MIRLSSLGRGSFPHRALARALFMTELLPPARSGRGAWNRVAFLDGNSPSAVHWLLVCHLLTRKGVFDIVSRPL